MLRKRRSFQLDAILPAEVLQLEPRICLSVNLHQIIATGDSRAIPLTGVHAGDKVIIKATLQTTDVDEFTESYFAESLHIVTSQQEFVDTVYSKQQLYTFTAQQDGESIRAFLKNFDYDETGTLDITIQQLTITIPVDQATYHITSDPKMPDIAAKATLTSPPDNQSIDLSQVKFTWQARISFPASDGLNAIADIPETVFTKTTIGPNVTFTTADWKGMIRGGRLVLTVQATINGADMEGTKDGLKILGDNPSADAVKAYISSFSAPPSYPSLGATFTYQQILTKIALQESDGTLGQFISDGTPLFSGANDGGAGIMQITPPTAEQVWDWKANVQAGVKKLNSSLELADRYVANLRLYINSSFLAATNTARQNQGLPPLVSIVIPNWTADQKVRDAVRGYNGYNGADPIDSALHLHQYALKRTPSGSLSIAIDPATLIATASWYEVPASDRPSRGDPDYVNHVWSR
jgi:hypothetical protein